MRIIMSINVLKKKKKNSDLGVAFDTVHVMEGEEGKGGQG